MPYFKDTSELPHQTKYYGYTGGEEPDAALTVRHGRPRTVMSVGANRWLSGDQFHQDVTDIGASGFNYNFANAQPGVHRHIEELQNTNRDYDKGVPFSESGLTYHHEDGVFRPADEDDQLQLFAYDPPGPSKVQYLVSRNTSGGKMAAMTMLGMADMDARADTGHPLQPSDDLSPYSMRIVRHLSRRGVVHPADVPDDIGNDMDFNQAEHFLGSAPTLARSTLAGNTDISSQARGARKHIKSLLRPAKATPKPREPKPEQLKLFED